MTILAEQSSFNERPFLAEARPVHVANCERIERMIARRFRVRLRDLYAAGRSGVRVSLARHTAMYLERVLLELDYGEIALRFARHPTLVSYACRRIEDLRDDPAFDGRIERMEEGLRQHAVESRL